MVFKDLKIGDTFKTTTTSDMIYRKVSPFAMSPGEPKGCFILTNYVRREILFYCIESLMNRDNQEVFKV